MRIRSRQVGEDCDRRDLAIALYTVDAVMLTGTTSRSPSGSRGGSARAADPAVRRRAQHAMILGHRRLRRAPNGDMPNHPRAHVSRTGVARLVVQDDLSHADRSR